jgi:hypothetical protein
MASDNLDSKIHFAQRGLGLTADEKAAIIAFLHTLTDEAFIKDSAFAAEYTSSE